MPPELLFNDYKLIDYSKIDVWSLGIILYRMIFNNQFPWNSNNLKDHKENLKNNKI